MSAPLLLEGTVDLILAKIKADIATALADVRTERADAKVSTEPPSTESYFRYYPAKAFKAPAVFVVGEEMGARHDEKGGNFITGLASVTVSVVVEDRDEERLTRKAFRYMSALHQILEQINLQDTGGKLKLFVRVERVVNGATYTKADQRDLAESVFRREVALYCEVDHFENY